MPSVGDLLHGLSLPPVPCNPATSYLIKVNCNPQGNGWVVTLIDSAEGAALPMEQMPKKPCGCGGCTRRVETNDIVIKMVELITWLKNEK